MNPDQLIEALGLEPLEPEGGWWSQSHIDEHGSTIHYLLRKGECSLLHQLPGPEVYFYQAGDPLDLLVLHPDGRTQRVVIGPDLDSGEAFQFKVPAGCWQGSTSTGAWTLVGTAMAPAFRIEDYRAGVRTELTRSYPDVTARICELTDA
ncbi:MAG: cupin domain-containing protein [Acidimicrobiales bacterium]|nr:cupin domain-containing protein [Acidimicrobiales bacterium]